VRTKLALISLVIILSSVMAVADNIVKYDSLVNYPTSHYSINLILENQDTLAGFQIPLTFIGTGVAVTMDSASFTNSSITGLSIQKYKIDSTGHGIYVFGVTNNDSASVILPNDHQICKIYFDCNLVDSTGTIMVQNSPWTIGKNHISFKLWEKGAVEVPSRFETNPIKF
jgi:hypothetical protein